MAVGLVLLVVIDRQIGQRKSLISHPSHLRSLHFSHLRPLSFVTSYVFFFVRRPTTNAPPRTAAPTTSCSTTQAPYLPAPPRKPYPKLEHANLLKNANTLRTRSSTNNQPSNRPLRSTPLPLSFVPESIAKDTSMLLATKYGVVEMLSRLFQHFPLAIRDSDQDKKNVVLLAAEYRQPDTQIETLFRAVDKNARNMKFPINAKLRFSISLQNLSQPMSLIINNLDFVYCFTMDEKRLRAVIEAFIERKKNGALWSSKMLPTVLT
uniref:Uncharacterized protein n=1 Tax=Cucumis melo TaxID=3656 RepID=A0A9I9EGI3_CUCME